MSDIINQTDAAPPNITANDEPYALAQSLHKHQQNTIIGVSQNQQSHSNSSINKNNVSSNVNQNQVNSSSVITNEQKQGPTRQSISKPIVQAQLQQNKFQQGLQQKSQQVELEAAKQQSIQNESEWFYINQSQIMDISYHQPPQNRDQIIKFLQQYQPQKALKQLIEFNFQLLQEEVEQKLTKQIKFYDSYQINLIDYSKIQNKSITLFQDNNNEKKIKNKFEKTVFDYPLIPQHLIVNKSKRILNVHNLLQSSNITVLTQQNQKQLQQWESIFQRLDAENDEQQSEINQYSQSQLAKHSWLQSSQSINNSQINLSLSSCENEYYNSKILNNLSQGLINQYVSIDSLILKIIDNFNNQNNQPSENNKKVPQNNQQEQIIELHQCAICQLQIQKNNLVIKTDCQHAYHEDCLQKWLTDYNKKSCPLCRSQLSDQNCLQIRGSEFYELQKLQISIINHPNNLSLNLGSKISIRQELYIKSWNQMHFKDIFGSSINNQILSNLSVYPIQQNQMMEEEQESQQQTSIDSDQGIQYQDQPLDVQSTHLQSTDHTLLSDQQTESDDSNQVIHQRMQQLD